MGARTDLMEVAGALATEARRLAHVPRPEIDDEYQSVVKMGGVEFRSLPAQAAELALGAKAALEAAALVDAEPAPIVAALERLIKLLDEETVGSVLDVEGPAAAIDHVGDLLDHARREVAVGAAIQHGYLALRELLTNLRRDFSIADTETARRIKARIESGLDDADEAITRARGQEASHG